MPDPAGAVDLAIIGAGRAGLHLAHALAVSARDRQTPSFRVALVCRSPERRARVEAWLAEDPVRSALSVVAEPVGLTAPLVVLAVPDRHLATAAGDTHQRSPGLRAAVRLHLSGVASPEVLRVLGSDAPVGSLHPLCALPDPLVAPESLATLPLRGALCAVAGDAEALPVALELVAAVGGTPVTVDPASRSAYHAAAALVANDLVALLGMGENLCREAGLPAVTARAGLLHLARTSLDALRAAGPDAPLAAGLTGAVARGDAPTLDRHLAALSGHPQAREAHRQLSLVLVELVAAAATVDPTAVEALRTALGRP